MTEPDQLPVPDPLDSTLDQAAAAAGDVQAALRFRILRLRHQQGLAVRDIAMAIGELDVAAVHNAYRRARRESRCTCVRWSLPAPASWARRSTTSVAVSARCSAPEDPHLARRRCAVLRRRVDVAVLPLVAS